METMYKNISQFLGTIVGFIQIQDKQQYKNNNERKYLQESYSVEKADSHYKFEITLTFM